jgi:hypothetical protein
MNYALFDGRLSNYTPLSGHGRFSAHSPTEGKDGSYRHLFVLVEIAILLNRICKVNTCHWLTHGLVLSSF